MEKFFKRYADFAVITAGVLWGIIGVFVNILTEKGLSAFDMMCIRSSFAFLCMAAILTATDREKLKIKLRDIWIFACLGIVCFFTYGALYCITIEITSMSTAAVLLYTSPVFIMIMARIFFKEKITKRKALAILITVIGCSLVSGGITANSGFLGIITGVLSGFFYGLYSIFGRIAAKKYSPLTTTFYTFIFTAVTSLFFADFGKISETVAVNPAILITFLLYAVVTAVLPYIFYTGALKYLPLTRAGVVVCVEPVVAMVVGGVIFGDKIGIVGLLGSLMILGAIILTNKQN